MKRGLGRKVAGNSQLRRLLTAWAAFYTGDLSHFALIVVFTFSAGGIPAVGAANILNVLPGGLLAPLAATLAVGRRPQLHLAMGIGARALVMVATVVAVLSGCPVGVVLALVAADSVVSAAVRPLHGGLVVRLADSADEAAAANAITGSILGASALAGPALAGLALGLLGIGWAFALPAAIFAVGTVAALLIALPQTDQSEARDERAVQGSVRTYLSVIGTGFGAILRSRPAAAAGILFVVSVALGGAWDVANAAVANDRLGLGEAGIPLIITLSGAGGLLAALGTMSIVGLRGLSRVLAGAMGAWAVTLVALAVIRLPAPGLGMAVGVGAAGAVAYAVAPTLLQRSVAKDAMVPAAASLQSLYLVANAAGAVIALILVERLGVFSALLVIGSAVAVIILCAWPPLRQADALSAEDAAKLAVIRATPMLAPLPPRALEQLARAATRLTVPAGAEVIRQGDRGDRFYIIAAGLADVTVDGNLVATLGPGGSFGEIALLHDVPRSATVAAREDLDLVVVDRAHFLGSLGSDTGAVGRVGGIAETRLNTLPLEERLIELDRDAGPDSRSIADLLAAQPPLAAIDAHTLRELAQAARVVAAPDGALITRQGDYGDTYYVILDGAAQVLEDETAVRMLGPGDGFGERAILRDIPRTATVRAVGDTTLVAVDRESFQRARQAAQGGADASFGRAVDGHPTG